MYATKNLASLSSFVIGISDNNVMAFFHFFEIYFLSIGFKFGNDLIFKILRIFDFFSIVILLQKLGVQRFRNFSQNDISIFHKNHPVVGCREKFGIDYDNQKNIKSSALEPFDKLILRKSSVI